jgi:hypothetical protein
MTDVFGNIEKLERDLWEAADNLRANSKLTSSDYFMPVLGVIFLRHAANRFDAAHRQIEADQASGKMPKRKVLPADYIARRSLYLPESAPYDTIMIARLSPKPKPGKSPNKSMSTFGREARGKARDPLPETELSLYRVCLSKNLNTSGIAPAMIEP